MERACGTAVPLRTLFCHACLMNARRSARSTFSEHLNYALAMGRFGVFRSISSSSIRGANCCVRTGPRMEVVSTKTKTVLRIRPSMRRWPAGSNVLNATRVAASVVATCGNCQRPYGQTCSGWVFEGASGDFSSYPFACDKREDDRRCNSKIVNEASDRRSIGSIKKPVTT